MTLINKIKEGPHFHLHCTFQILNLRFRANWSFYSTKIRCHGLLYSRTRTAKNSSTHTNIGEMERFHSDRGKSCRAPWLQIQAINWWMVQPGWSRFHLPWSPTGWVSRLALCVEIHFLFRKKLKRANWLFRFRDSFSYRRHSNVPFPAFTRVSFLVVGNAGNPASFKKIYQNSHLVL